MARLHYVLTDLAMAGAERMVLALVAALREEHQIEVVALRGPGELGPELERLGIPVLVLQARPARAFAALQALRRHWRAKPPELIHAHLWHGALFAHCSRPLAAPVITSWHVVPERAEPVRTAIARRLVARDAASVGVSRAVTDWVQGTLRAPRAVCIPNGIAPRTGRLDRAEVRARWGIPASAPVVGFVGRLHRQKGVDILLAAAATLGVRHPDLVLVVAGRGPQAERLQRDAGRRGLDQRVRWLGFQDDPAPVYAAADVIAIPSRTEGFGLVALEALAAGCPVVATAVPGLQEVLAGIAPLVPKDDERALARALAQALDQRPRRADEDAVRERLDRYRLADCIAKHRALYAAVLEGAPWTAFGEPGPDGKTQAPRS